MEDFVYYEEVVQETIKNLNTLRCYHHACGNSDIAYSLEMAIVAVKKLPTKKLPKRGKDE